jgi:3-oxoacyl-[acyl-carrier protein] reductase
MKLKGKTAVVTGASKGIGAAIAKKLAAEGASVVVNYATSAAGAEEVVNSIKSTGGKAVAVQGNMRLKADIDKVFATAQKEFGGVDVVVNNAGVYEFLPLEAVTEEHIDQQYSLNVRGLILATQAAVKAMGDKGGSIVNISSTVVQTPPPGSSVYSSTKGAVDIFTRALAGELGPKKIRINSLSPGLTATEGLHAMPGIADFQGFAVSRTPLGRMGQPDDIADAVAFLASDDARWVTGQILGASGGLML